MRLYEKEELEEIIKLILSFKKALGEKIKSDEKVSIPGYTHMQKAMPTTIKNWLDCFICALKDDMFLVEQILKLIDKNKVPPYI